MNSTGIIFSHDWHYPASINRRNFPDFTPSARSSGPVYRQAGARITTSSVLGSIGTSGQFLLGLGMIALALGGAMAPLIPRMQQEAKYALLRTQSVLTPKNAETVQNHTTPIAPVVPVIFSPLQMPDGTIIEPVNKEFSLVIPKIGVNSAVIPAVNPNKPGEYKDALKRGIAHSSLSFFPDQDGTVYLFSHSTNYEWWVRDLNAVFYLLKNLETDDEVVLFYKDAAYTYKITGKQVVNPTDIEYLAPQPGARRLILQTCWPPGSTSERLLIFADLIENPLQQI